mgnify:CR=1 FL=1
MCVFFEPCSLWRGTCKLDAKCLQNVNEKQSYKGILYRAAFFDYCTGIFTHVLPVDGQRAKRPASKRKEDKRRCFYDAAFTVQGRISIGKGFFFLFFYFVILIGENTLTFPLKKCYIIVYSCNYFHSFMSITGG